MSTTARSKDIDGFSYTVQQLPATRSIRLLHRLGKLVGPGFTELASTGNLRSLSGADVSILIMGIVGILKESNEDALMAVIKELLVGTVAIPGPVDVTGPQFETHFQGRLLALFELLAFALEVNYGSFFGGLALALGQGASASTSPTP